MGNCIGCGADEEDYDLTESPCCGERLCSNCAHHPDDCVLNEDNLVPSYV